MWLQKFTPGSQRLRLSLATGFCTFESSSLPPDIWTQQCLLVLSYNASFAVRTNPPWLSTEMAWPTISVGFHTCENSLPNTVIDKESSVSLFASYLLDSAAAWAAGFWLVAKLRHV